MSMQEPAKKHRSRQERMTLFTAELKEEILGGKLSKGSIAKRKIILSKKHGLGTIPSDIEVLMQLPSEDYELMKQYLSSKPTRQISGVHVVALMSKPHRCPHGKCTMCPGGIGSIFGDVPQSYTGNEPATMRAIRNRYDPYLQVFNRLEQYVLLGIYPQKIEVIIMGGTFLFCEEDYKQSFVGDIYRAMNDFSRMFFTSGGFDLVSFKEFFELPHEREDTKHETRIQEKILNVRSKWVEKWPQLHDVQTENDLVSSVKCVGLTIETKPDYGRHEHGKEMLLYGCTRVELGVQSVFDKALHAMHRGHTLQESKDSIKELRDLGFKLNFHVMLGVPGISREEEQESLPLFFSDDAYKPDMIKIYPLMVMPGTALEVQYKRGAYTPLRTDEAAPIIASFMGIIPPYCRIMRVQRDIPPKFSTDGVHRSNLRQYVDDIMKEKAIVCNDIRQREVGTFIKQGGDVSYLHPTIHVQTYDAAGGKEYFISTEDQGVLFGFVRMRIPSKDAEQFLGKQTAIIRELHVYGHAASLGMRQDDAGGSAPAQHKGYGKLLMQQAEEIARSEKMLRMLVISGVGVRGYYRKLGYELDEPYMAKNL